MIFAKMVLLDYGDPQYHVIKWGSGVGGGRGEGGGDTDTDMFS